MEGNINGSGYYKNKLIEYAQNKIDRKLEKEGKLIKNTAPTYVIYARRSTKGKKRQERSLPDQIKACQKLAEDKKLTVRGLIQEKESARKHGVRDRFYEMLDGIRKKRYNSIITWHPDRLARNMKDAGTIFDMLETNQIIDLQFPTYTFTKDTNGVMALGIQFVMAKQYSDNLSATSSRGSKNKVQEGKANITKYGYLLDKNYYLRPDKHSYPLLKKAFRMALDRQPLVIIADYLNKNKFEYNKKVTKMTKQKLSSIFNDPFFAGIHIYSDQIIDMSKIDPEFEQIITPLDFLELRNIFDIAKGFKKVKASEILLRDMVKCFYCGNYMTPGKPRSSGRSRLRYLRLICTNQKCIRRFEKKPNGKTIPKDIRAKVIFDYMIKVLQGNIYINEEGYNQYVNEAKKQLSIDRVDYIQQLKILARKIKEFQSDLDEKTKAITIIKNQKVMDELNEQISKLSDEKNISTTKRDEIEKYITDIDHSIQSELVSYENLLNFFNNIVGIIQNHNNRLLIDKVIRMVFLNFTVDYEKVLSHQLNPSFERYVKLPSVLSSRSGGT